MKENVFCPCGSQILYTECCQPIIKGLRNADTAEELMRSRYSAYVNVEIDYLINSTHITQRHLYTEENLREWAENSKWLKLEIINTKDGNKNNSTGYVEFKAYYLEDNQEKVHHELSLFKKENGIWFFVNGSKPMEKTEKEKSVKVGRNDPCPCGSGKKYKKCCG